jgi:hypothetical protein
MEQFKYILILIFSIIFGFGLWYLIFWFLTTEYNLFLWHWVTKIVYLLLSISSSSSISDNNLNKS